MIQLIYVEGIELLQGRGVSIEGEVLIGLDVFDFDE